MGAKKLKFAKVWELAVRVKNEVSTGHAQKVIAEVTQGGKLADLEKRPDLWPKFMELASPLVPAKAPRNMRRYGGGRHDYD